jgi:hypothetical protein
VSRAASFTAAEHDPMAFAVYPRIGPGQAAIWMSCTAAVGVDAINTFGVSAGHFASFGVVSRRQIPAFRSSRRFSEAGSIPGSSAENMLVTTKIAGLSPLPSCLDAHRRNANMLGASATPPMAATL